MSTWFGVHMNFRVPHVYGMRKVSVFSQAKQKAEARSQQQQEQRNFNLFLHFKHQLSTYILH
jgi:hypothetical protein